MSGRRQVRVAPSFFDRLDELFPEERSPTGVPSTADFLLHEMPPLIDLLALDYEAATLEVRDVPEVRVLVATGVLVAHVAPTLCSATTIPSRSSTSRSTTSGRADVHKPPGPATSPPAAMRLRGALARYRSPHPRVRPGDIRRYAPGVGMLTRTPMEGPAADALHHGSNMSPLEQETGLERAINRIPAPIRIGTFIAWAAVAVDVRLANDVPLWLWGVQLAGLALMAAFGLITLARSFGAPDRRPLDLYPFWVAYLVITGSLLVLGPMTFLDDDPATKPYIGGPMFLVGAVLVALAVRHLAKPVRPED